MKHNELKVGDLVRVPGNTVKGACRHSLPQGSVVEVVRVGHDYADMKNHAGTYTQGCAIECLKLAKQAMRKRDKYEARRG